MLIIGHRGASGVEPENTIRSFKKAIEEGVNMVELDVRRSKDGELVVFHDWTLKRLFDVRKTVSSLTLKELKEISEYREIPTLEEVLANINSDVNVEIKVRGIEAQVLEKIKNFPHNVLVSSFHVSVLKKIRALDGNIKLGLIIVVRRFPLIAITNFLTRKLNLYSIHPRNYLVNTALVSLLRRTGKKIFVWSVNNRREYKRMKELGVDGIFTDYPELMSQYEQDRGI